MAKSPDFFEGSSVENSAGHVSMVVAPKPLSCVILTLPLARPPLPHNTLWCNPLSMAVVGPNLPSAMVVATTPKTSLCHWHCSDCTRWSSMVVGIGMVVILKHSPVTAVLAQ